VPSKKSKSRSVKSPRSDRAPERPRLSGWTSSLLAALVLTGAVAWAYSTSFAGVFVMDDKFAIADNPNIKTLWPLTTAMSAPPEMPVSGRPVASLTLAINYALAPDDVRDVLSPGGPSASGEVRERFLRNVWGYHFFNLILHLLAALALYGVLRRTLLSNRLRARFGEAAAWIAGIASLIWVVHPLTSDAVTYVVQRTEVLMGLFLFLTLYCSIRAADGGVRVTVRRWWIAAAIVACALGMGSKQTMVVAPVIVALWDWIFGDEPAGFDAPRLRARGPLYAGLAATWIILGSLVAMERWPHSIGFAREGWTPWTYLLTQSGVIVHYLRLSVALSPLALDYDGWPMACSILEALPYAIPLLIALGATVFAIVRRQPWGFLGGWFFATLAPSSSVLPLATEIAAERRMYLPLVSLVVGAVIVAYLIGGKLLEVMVGDLPRRRTVGLIATVLVAGTLAMTLGSVTYARNRDFWSDEGIWRDTVEKRPTNPRARVSYGVDLYAAGQLPDAERELREAVRLKETSAPAHANLGAVLCAQGNFDDGIRHLERALALDPEYHSVHGNLAEAYAARGRRALAAQEFARAVDLAPGNPFLLNRLAWLLATSSEVAVRNGPRAVELAQRAVSITNRQDVMSLETLSAAYAEVGRFDDALATGREALALAERQGNETTAADLARRLPLFEQHQKYREPE
jgi:protein O-mannosyl-transferase